VYGPKTQGAVVDFQTTIYVDGIASKEIIEKLKGN
jgi:hypothetical protein